jgi:hypothetical protein
MVTLCLAGPEAEREFCGPINEDGDRIDYEMARKYLARQITNPLQAAAELARYRDVAQRLVRSAWARKRIAVIARRFAAKRHAEQPANIRANRLLTIKIPLSSWGSSARIGM